MRRSRVKLHAFGLEALGFRAPGALGKGIQGQGAAGGTLELFDSFGVSGSGVAG